MTVWAKKQCHSTFVTWCDGRGETDIVLPTSRVGVRLPRGKCNRVCPRRRRITPRKYAVFRARQIGPCGSRLPNAWGLFDYARNLSGGCQDFYAPYPDTSSLKRPAGPRRANYGRVGAGTFFPPPGDAARHSLPGSRRHALASTSPAVYLTIRYRWDKTKPKLLDPELGSCPNSFARSQTTPFKNALALRRFSPAAWRSPVTLPLAREVTSIRSSPRGPVIFPIKCEVRAMPS